MKNRNLYIFIVLRRTWGGCHPLALMATWNFYCNYLGGKRCSYVTRYPVNWYYV